MRCELHRRKNLEIMITRKGDYLMLRQGVHHVVAVLAIFIALIALLIRGNTGIMMSTFAILGAPANTLLMLNCIDETKKFRRQLEGYRKLCR